MPDDRELDLILDSALKTYGEPNPGLEDRVLSALAEVRSPVRFSRASRRWQVWAFALPLAACLLLLVFLVKWVRQPIAGLEPNTELHMQAAISPVQSNPSVPLHPALTRGVRKPRVPAKLGTDRAILESAPLPKRDFFPTPQPLTAEEQALYVYATQTPEKQRQAILDARKNDDAPLNFAAISIPPIEMPDTGKN